MDVGNIKYHVDLLWEEFQLPIWVTEFDWNAHNAAEMGDHSVHAQQIQNFYRLMFSHQAVEGIMMWNLNIISEETGQPNKAGEEYMRLYHEEWRSNNLLTPEEEGGFYYRGFMGNYTLRLLWRGEEVGKIEVKVDEDKDLVCMLNSDLTFVC